MTDQKQHLKIICHVILSLILTSFIIACSGPTPEYIAKANSYSFDFLNTKNGDLLSESMVYTFNSESMQQNYTKSFCAGVKDCNQNINSIKNSSLFGGFDLSQKPISRNKLGVSKVNVYRLSYTTTGQNNELRKVSGAVFIPNIPANKIKGIILYFHPTFFAKNSTPSFGMESNNQDNTLVSVFGSNGYIVAAPDYIGMGIDTSVPHPYALYPLVNANDGLSLLTATNQFLEEKRLYIKPQLPLLITGFSEGSSYALWFSRLYQEQKKFREQLNNTNFKLTLVAPISGAYDLSGVIYNYLLDNISIWGKDKYRVYSSMVAAKLKPGLTAFAFVSYAYYNQKGDYSKVFNPAFFNMQCKWQNQKNCDFESQHLTLAQAFEQADDLQIVSKIVNAASYKSAAGTIFTSQSNSVIPLINQDILKNQDFINTFNNADIYYWHSTFPTTLIYLAQDSVVSPYNTQYAYRGMQENHSTNLKTIAIDNSLIKANAVDYLPDFDVDHVIALPYVTLVALEQFEAAIRK